MNHHELTWPIAVAFGMLVFSLGIEAIVQFFCESKTSESALNLRQWQSGACMILLFALGFEAYRVIQ